VEAKSSHCDIWYVRSITVFLLFLLGFQLMSCMPVIKLVYGIHKPRYVSDSAVVKYYNRLGLQGEIYRLKDYNSGNRKKFRYLGNTMPDVLLFNSKGYLTKFDIDCSKGLDSIVKLSLHDIDSMSLEGKSIQDFIDDTYVINNLNNKEIHHLNMPLYVVKFADYAGKLNKENVPALIAQLNLRSDIHYVILNMDYSVPE